MNVVNTVGLINAVSLMTANAATSTVVDETEDFVLDLDGDFRTAIVVENGTGHGDITLNIAEGTGFWMGNGASGDQVVAAGTKAVMYLESAKFADNAGDITIVASPAAGKRLLTDHAMVMYVLEEPVAN